MTLTYLWSKFIKKVQLPSIKDTYLESPCRIQAQSTLVSVSMGRYSYCGYGCTLLDCKIGRFCSIADGVFIGGACHPMDWVSTSPAFYYGQRRSIPDHLAGLSYEQPRQVTVIGHDVWIGKNAMIKSGVIVGNGAVIGMGAVVTKDVPAYSIVAGNPAKLIRMRFSDDVIKRLMNSCWWEMEPEKLKKYVPLMECPEEFLNAMECER